MKNFLWLFLVIVIILGLVYSLGEHVVMTLAGTSKYTPIHRVQTNENKMTFTFNVESYHENLTCLLKKLKEHEVTATFFLSEEVISNNEDLVRKIYLLGHQIGWLLADTFDLAEESLKTVTEKIESVSYILQKNIGVKLEVLRPMSYYNDTLLVACKNLGIFCVLWDIDSKDRKEIGTNDIVRRITSSSQKGSIILFDLKGRYTLGAISILLEDFKENKIGLVPLSELLHKEKYKITSSGEQIKRGE